MSVIVFALFITVVFSFSMFGPNMLYDISILPDWAWFLIRLFFPFSTVMSATAKSFYGNKFGTRINSNSLAYEVYQNAFYNVSTFFSD